MKTLSRMLLAALLLAVPFAMGARAADEGPQYEGIPSYSVTRLKIFEGTVWVRTPDSGEWEEFPDNSPVPERARISVPDDSEAELQFHGGQYMLLTGGTELDLRRLEDDRSVFRLRSGEIRFDLPAEDFSPVRVQMPDDARVDFEVPGKYWLTAPEDEDSRLVVRAGEATVTTDRGKQAVRRGEEARIGRDVRVGPYAGPPEESGPEAPALSDEEKKAGVPPAAAHELREYGEWVYSSEFGYVWRPRVAPGWSPYYYGRWTWISPFGWTWISYEPWGWYPYHYGYWYTDPVFGWVWYPFRTFVSVGFVFGHVHYPHYHRRVYFVPATVRFVGYGTGVRWVPLRPGERIPRIRYTRADRRLVRWERRLPARTVYVRERGRKADAWKDWNEARRERRRSVEARTREIRKRRIEGRPPRVERKDGGSRKGGEAIRSRSDRRRSGDGPRERVRERREQPSERRMERRERPERESRRPAVRPTPPVSRRGGGRMRPDPAALRVDRAVREPRTSARPESFGIERGGREGRSFFDGGGWNRGSGFRRIR